MRVGVRKLSSQSLGLHSIRNVGIIAHIDAGKTTTTERMLFFSGKSRNLGDVDDGNTVTDYLVEERQRGITIQSACVTFPWREHRINLIDSPGHVDFTFEVERSIRVLDGAVAILDGVAGVEAQTETVWRQSLRYNVPRMVYINKLDRDGSSFSRSLESLRNKFPLSCFVPIQFPILTKGFAPIVGLVDLVDQMEMRWKGDRGQDMEEIDVSESHPLYEEFEIRRGEMIETLADHSDVIAEHFLESIPVSRALLKKEIRSLVADGKIVPVLCGSSYKNLGVQTLLDAVCDYLPSPLERPDVAAHEMILEGGLLRTGSRKALKSDPRGDLCAMVFKVVYDPRRGPVNFVRVFSGTLNAKDLVSLSRLSKGSKGVPPAVIKERAARILELYGSDWNDVESVSAGNICAIVGMKNAHTGDTISGGSRQKPLKLDGISIPDPVFSASIEAHSTSDEAKLETALQFLQLEDPSIKVVEDVETSQKLLQGMGELHLEIAHGRLLNHFGVRAYMGKVQVAYRESISLSSFDSIQYAAVFENKDIQVCIDLEVSPSDSDLNSRTVSSEVVEILPVESVQALYDGIDDALMRGILMGYPFMRVCVDVKKVVWECEGELPVFALHAACSKGTSDLLKKSSPFLLEPIMSLEIWSSPDFVGSIVSDLSSKRRASIGQVDNSMQIRPEVLISASIPLAETIGYATVLRSLSQGTAQYSLTLAKYETLPQQVQKSLISNLGWG